MNVEKKKVVWSLELGVWSLEFGVASHSIVSSKISAPTECYNADCARYVSPRPAGTDEHVDVGNNPAKPAPFGRRRNAHSKGTLARYIVWSLKPAEIIYDANFKLRTPNLKLQAPNSKLLTISYPRASACIRG